MTLRRIVLGGGLMAILILTASEATAQNFRSRFPTRPATPAPQANPALVTPYNGALANPNFSNLTPSVNTFSPNANTFNPGVNNFNPAVNNFSPFANPAFNNYSNYGAFTPFANPYGYNPLFNQGYFPAANPFATPFNPFFGNGMYNPYLGY